MKIFFKFGKICIYYYDFKNKNKVVFSILDLKILKNVKNISIIQSKLIGKIKLSNNVSINGPGTVISALLNEIIIKSYVSIAPNVNIIEHSHNYKHATTYFINKKIHNKFSEKDITSKGKIIIEEDVWIGAGAIVLGGAHLGRGSVIGALSLVNKRIEKYTIVGGNPCQLIKKRFTDDNIEKIEKLEWWNWSDVKIHEKKDLIMREYL